MNCLFCKIINGEIPSNKAYEDESVYAFHDIDPQAPFHVLIIPKKHIASAARINAENSSVVAHIYEVAAKLAEQYELKNGFRIVTNCGKDGGQSVDHLHFHMLAKRNLAWPPG